jgi:hypothetical protein
MIVDQRMVLHVRTGIEKADRSGAGSASVIF